MADEQSSDARPQAGQATTPRAGSTDDSQADDSTISLEEARKLRSENATLRRRAKEAEDRVRSQKDSELPELERAQKKIQEYEAKEASWLRERQTSALKGVLTGAGAIYPDLLADHVDLADLDWDDKGRLRNDDQVVRSLRKSYPSLFRSPSADGGAGGGGAAPADDMNSRIRRAAGRG